jgi:hypothetical protein
MTGLGTRDSGLGKAEKPCHSRHFLLVLLPARPSAKLCRVPSDALLPQLALRAIGFADVCSGILPVQSASRVPGGSR